ncbi:putative E3 ubiquitin-protein ligase DTX3 [Crassostrea virginica]
MLQGHRDKKVLVRQNKEEEPMEVDEISECVICMDNVQNKKTLEKCSHEFCKDCIDSHFKYKPQCPICFTAYGIVRGTQPDGYMEIKRDKRQKVPGFTEVGFIRVYYSFSDGTQGPEHPNPGQRYHGTSRTGYLPDNEKGRIVARLLRVAFDRKLVFTVGRSRTTGMDNCVTWNDIHHKTSISGGPENFGYPDPTFLDRVLEELAAKGVTQEDLCQVSEDIIK